MKLKSLFTLASTLFSLNSFAQSNTFPTTGNVGIGTETPEGTLEIKKLNSGLVFDLNTNGLSKIISKGWSANVDFNTFKINGTQNLSQLHLNSNGNVGIGTASPTSLLQIGDFNTSVASKALLIPGVYNFEQLRLGQLGNGNSALEMINHNGLASSYGIRLMTNIDVAGGLHFQYALPTTSYESLSYQTTMFMDLNGRVGIGTTTPDEKLAVNGKIHTQEVRVDLKGWPDYVFEPGYKVGTLEELERYINANKHLPEMPSAKEVEANGIELGEMNKLLLKKVEELTLHMIEQQKEMMNLKKEINVLKDCNKRN
nr:hypothetical protein [Pedobacter sp. ASV2]